MHFAYPLPWWLADRCLVQPPSRVAVLAEDVPNELPTRRALLVPAHDTKVSTDGLRGVPDVHPQARA